MQKHGNKYGTHRVIEPVGVLPQPANKLNNNMDEIWDNEILIDVQTL
ncbi:MAG: L-erythro-3,5-diaminohexanoate dehydrogenase, partial [Bacteroidales bacterium]|nr:L-erythro-3,5-diaminohexanoate dehydrogenase [Bacteroidales bacterium]